MACTAKLDVGASQEPASPAESNVLILAWTDSVLMLNIELNVSMEILSYCEARWNTYVRKASRFSSMTTRSSTDLRVSSDPGNRVQHGISVT